ncbi:MAG: hypothetical protein HQL06_15595 [Nitrospirae bacterium]|nr:hypothetical protein [Nitrospirota bacterium]
MKFDNIHKDIDVNCITDEVRENTTDIFLRKLYKNTLPLHIQDFQSYWEEGKRQPKEKICMLKGVSVFKGGIDEIVDTLKKDEKKKDDKIKENKKFKPKAKQYRYYCSLRFKKDAGKIWKTGSQHYTFFKSDSFDTDKLEILEIKSLE